MKRIGWLAVLALVVSRCCAQQVVWTYAPPAGSVDTSPAVGDLTGDGRVEVVVGTTSGMVIALSGQGKVLWRHELRDTVCIPPTIADANGDGLPDVLVATLRGLVECLSGRSGDVLWRTTLPAPVQYGSTSLTVGDLRGDGAMEVVTGTSDGRVVCLSGATGERLWTLRGAFGYVTSPAIADLKGDGRSEVIVGTEKAGVLCLSAGGRVLWRSAAGVAGSPIVCRTRRNGPPVILDGVGKAILALDSRGKRLWSYPMPGELDGAISVGDVDDNGRPDIFAVDLTGHVVSLTGAGKLRWQAEVGERVRRSPSIGDVDGDGKPEVLVAGYSDALFVFDAAQGKVKARVPLPGHSNGTPTLARLGSAGLSIVLAVTASPVEVLRWSTSRRDARVLWPEYRYDTRRTGVVLGPGKPTRVGLTVDFGGLRAGGSVVTATASNPDRHRLTVSVEAQRAGGKPALRIVNSTATRIQARLGYTLPRSGSAAVTLTCRVSDGGRTLARRSRMLYVHAFDKEIASLSGVVARVEKLASRLPDRRGIEDRACLVDVKLARLRSQVAQPAPVTVVQRAALGQMIGVLRDEIMGVRRLAVVAEAASRAGRTVEVCAANPWAPFGGLDELSEGRAGSAALTVAAFRGETESAALNVFNLSSRPRTFRVELSALAQGTQSVRASDAVRLFSVIDVPTERYDTSPDALATLGAANVLEVPAWSARQLWLNVDARHLDPGDWKGVVTLRSLEVVPVEVRAPIAVTVWSPRLPAKQALRNCGWGYVESSCLKDHPAAALADQVAHGTNVFVSTFYPKARFDADGNLIGEIDYSEHDAYVKAHAPHGIILFCGYQGALQGAASVESAAYGKAYVQWVRAWVKHLAGLGVGYDGFAFYPVDEPGLHKGLVETYLRLAKLTREADPRILMYTDPVSPITEQELREMVPYVDIWCPNRAGMILDPPNAGKLAIIQATGKPVWTYECSGDAKHQPPLGYYRGQAWLAWSHGMTGIGFWSYCTSPDDPWFAPHGPADYLLVYPGDGVVSSKRWEAVRDGVEDYDMLAALRRKVADAGASERPDLIAAAKSLLGEQAAAIGRFCIRDDDRDTPGPAGQAARRRLEDRRWAAYQAIRAELARLLERL